MNLEDIRDMMIGVRYDSGDIYRLGTDIWRLGIYREHLLIGAIGVDSAYDSFIEEIYRIVEVMDEH